MAPSAVNEARRELAQLRSMIDDARRELGTEAKPAQISAQRSGRRPGSRKAARAARKSSVA